MDSFSLDLKVLPYTLLCFFFLSAGNQAAQSCRLRVEQDWTQTSISSRIRQHLYHKVGQPGLSHRASHCTIYTLCKYYAAVSVFSSSCRLIFYIGMSQLVSGGSCNGKYTEEPLSSHSSQDVQEPGENCQSLRSAGSSQEETGMISLLCLWMSEIVA